MQNDKDLPEKADEYGRTVSPYFNIEDKQEKYRADKLFKRLRRKVGHAIGDYGMIEEGDKILNFSLIPVHIDSGFPNSPEHLLEDHLKKVGLDYIMAKRPVYEICKEKVPQGTPYCSMCSRLRRGYLYSLAREIGANKLALGHHRDDSLATFFLNLFYSGMMKAMPPVLRTDSDDLTVIRPLIYCREKDIYEISKLKQYPVLPKGLCGWGEDQQRANMIKMIRSWDKEFPKRADIAFKALKNVAPSHLLDRELFDFSKITNGPKVK